MISIARILPTFTAETALVGLTVEIDRALLIARGEATGRIIQETPYVRDNTDGYVILSLGEVEFSDGAGQLGAVEVPAEDVRVGNLIMVWGRFLLVTEVTETAIWANRTVPLARTGIATVQSGEQARPALSTEHRTVEQVESSACDG